MAKTETTKYKFTVKEGSSPEKPIWLMCEPKTKELSFLGSDGFLSILLNEGTTIEEAEEIKKFFNKNISGIGVTTF